MTVMIKSPYSISFSKKIIYDIFVGGNGNLVRCYGG